MPCRLPLSTSLLSTAPSRLISTRSIFKVVYPTRAFSSSPFIMAAQQWKLKDLTSLDVKPFELKEVPVEGIKDVSVLLTNVNGKVHATSSKCTHYGAPLAKGVVTSEGRLTCPWHGACFNVKSGDVEDAPALDPITTFQVVEKDGGVYITSDEETLKANRTTLNISCKAAGGDRIVVVGGGSGAVGLIEALRSSSYKGPITVISKEGRQPYDRTKLSKALISDLSKVAWRSEDYYKGADIDIQHDEATSVDFNSKTVSTKSGQTHSYSKLVLAPGGIPKSLPLPGLKEGELENVFLLRDLQHTSAINAALAESDSKKKVVVIGSSFIGLEVGNNLAGQGHDVTVVGMESEPCENVFGAKVGKIFRAILEKNGVKFKLSAGVEKGAPSEKNSKRIGAVHLKGGDVLPAEVVIEGVGVGPATNFLKESTGAPELLKDGSLKVNNKFEVEGAKDVYAIGDIATYPYAGKHVRIEHWDVAQNAGRTVAKAIAQPQVAVRPFVPIFWSALGAQLRYCGHPVDGWDDVIVDGQTDVNAEGGVSFAAYYYKGDDIVAVASMMKDPVMVQAAELMRTGKMLKRSQIKSSGDLLAASL